MEGTWLLLPYCCFSWQYTKLDHVLIIFRYIYCLHDIHVELQINDNLVLYSSRGKLAFITVNILSVSLNLELMDVEVIKGPTYSIGFCLFVRMGIDK